MSISNHIKRDKLYIHYSLRFFFSPEVMHVEIHNEKKIFSRHELLKPHSLQRDLTALKIESTVYSETPLANYQSLRLHIPQDVIVC